MSRVYSFVDGGYLRSNYEQQMKEFYGSVPKIVYRNLAGVLGGERTYYYDAINEQQRKDDETPEQCKERVAAMRSLHEHIASQTGYHVREGRVRRSIQKDRQEQKGVDIQLAVDALEHAARGNMRQAILFTGDLDFEPLLTSLARLGVQTKLFYVQQHASPELLRAADEIQRFTLEQFYTWAAPSFHHAGHHQVHLYYHLPPPDASAFKEIKHGKWDSRKATLYEATGAALGRLYIEPGDELSEPSYTMEYPNPPDLPKAFELTFGEIDWEPTGASV